MRTECSAQPLRTNKEQENGDLDERHLVFECLELLCFRERWSHLFEGPQTMQAFMWQEDLIGVAKFVTACLRKMNP